MKPSLRDNFDTRVALLSVVVCSQFISHIHSINFKNKMQHLRDLLTGHKLATNLCRKKSVKHQLSASLKAKLWYFLKSKINVTGCSVM